MKISHWLFLAILLFPFFSSAQSNFKPGYIISLTGDTVKGDVNYQQWDKNPGSVSFREVNKTQVIKYNIYNINGFGVYEAEYYEKYIITASTAEIEISNISFKDTTLRADTVLLKQLCKGPIVNLYQYTDKIKTRYYVKQPNKLVPNELLYQVYLDDDNERQVITKPYYQQELIKLAIAAGKADIKLINRINKTGYYNKEISSIVNLINSVSPTKAISVASGLRLFVGAGVNVQSLKYHGNINLARDAKSSENPFPLIQFGIDVFPNRLIQRYFFRAELNFTGSNMTVSAPGVTQTLEQRTLSLTPQFIWNAYNAKTVKVFTGLGVQMNFSNYPKSIIKTASNSEDNALAFTKFFYSLPIHAGVTLQNKYEFNFSYAFSSAITNYLVFSATPYSYQASFKYLFK